MLDKSELNRSLARRAVRMYNNDMVPKSTNRHNQKSWLRSVHLLGDRWLLAKPQGRLSTTGDRT